MQASLETVNRKLRRAREDLEALKSEVAVFDKDKTSDSSVEIDPQDGSHVFRFHVLKQPDPEWEITVGEVAYQMRSSLDQIVTQLVILNGGDPDNHKGSFPIYDCSEDYWKKVKWHGRRVTRRDIYLDGVAAEHRTLIDALQPYDRGPRLAKHDPLFVLNEICNGDKHRYGYPALLVLRSIAILKVSPLASQRVVVEHFGSQGDLDLARGKPVDDGSEIIRIRLDEPLPADVDIVPVARVGVAFGERRFFAFDLDRILDYLETKVVPKFAPLVK
jgi:hypothetical protein